MLQISQQKCKHVGHIFLTNMHEHTSIFYKHTLIHEPIRIYQYDLHHLHIRVPANYVLLLQSQTNILKQQ